MLDFTKQYWKVMFGIIPEIKVKIFNKYKIVFAYIIYYGLLLIIPIIVLIFYIPSFTLVFFDEGLPNFCRKIFCKNEK